MSKTFSRKARVAKRYDVNVRTVDRMAKDGRIPPPHYRGRIPLWDDDELDASDRASVAHARPRPEPGFLLKGAKK